MSNSHRESESSTETCSETINETPSTALIGDNSASGEAWLGFTDCYWNNAEYVKPEKASRVWCEDCVQWLGDEDEAPIVADAMNPSIGEIAAVLESNNGDFTPALEQLNGVGAIGSQSLLKEVYPLRSIQVLMGYQQRYFVVKDWGGQPRVCHLDTEGRLRVRSFTAFRDAEANVQIEVGRDSNDNPIIKPAAKYWLHHQCRHEYDEVRFMPGRRAPSSVYNLWRGWPTKWQNGVARKMRHHLLHHMCGGDFDVYRWVMGWLAHAIQKVHETPTTAIVLSGPQGSGKNRFVELFSQILGQDYTLMCTSSEQLVGNFNAQLQDKLLVFANEAFFAGNKKEANTLKSLVTDRTIVIEPKGVDRFTAKKHFRLIIASNEEHVVRLDVDDRRFCVLNVDAEEHNNDREYFADLTDAWEKRGEREMFLKELMDYNLSDWNEGKIPETEARQEQRRRTLPNEVSEIETLLHEGAPKIIDLNHKDGSVLILSERFTRAHGAALRAAGGRSGGNKRTPEGIRKTWWLPHLQEARKRFAESYRVRPDWQNNSHMAEWFVEDTALPPI